MITITVTIDDQPTGMLARCQGTGAAGAFTADEAALADKVAHAITDVINAHAKAYAKNGNTVVIGHTGNRNISSN
jgi:flagellar motor protein MotB